MPGARPLPAAGGESFDRYLRRQGAGAAARGHQGPVLGAVLRLAGRASDGSHPARHVARRGTGSAALREQPRPRLDGRGRLLDQPGGARGDHTPISTTSSPTRSNGSNRPPTTSTSTRLVEAFVKNAGLGFAIPYLHNGQMHDYVPDFIIRLKTAGTVPPDPGNQGLRPVEDVKRAAAERWVAAVNAEGSFGHWEYALAKKVSDTSAALNAALAKVRSSPPRTAATSDG